MQINVVSGRFPGLMECGRHVEFLFRGFDALPQPGNFRSHLRHVVFPSTYGNRMRAIIYLAKIYLAKRIAAEHGRNGFVAIAFANCNHDGALARTVKQNGRRVAPTKQPSPSGRVARMAFERGRGDCDWDHGCKQAAALFRASKWKRRVGAQRAEKKKAQT